MSEAKRAAGPPPLAIEVNGRSREVPAGSSVLDLVRELGLADHRIAVERNLEVVPRATYATVVLAAGDRLEIVSFVGGG